MRSIVNSLDWEVSAKGSIGSAAAEIEKKAQRLAERSAQLADISRNGALEFRNADMSLARSMKDSLESMRQLAKSVAALSLGSNVSMSTGGKKTEDFFSKVSGWFDRAWNGAKDLAQGVADGVGSLLGGIKDFLKENKVVSNVVDGFQFILDIAGFVPGFGEIADGVNAGIYALRGDYVNAGLSAAAAIPFAGWFATGGKFINKGIKALDKADSVYDTAKGAMKAGDVAEGIGILKNGMFRVGEGGTSIDPHKFDKMKAAFERQGGIIDQSEEAQRYLDYKGAEAVTWNESTIQMRPNPTTSDVFEEFIHTAQYRAGKIPDQLPKTVLTNEIEAAEKLIKYRKAYGIPNNETRQTVQRLRNMRNELKELLGR